MQVTMIGQSISQRFSKCAPRRRPDNTGLKIYKTTGKGISNLPEKYDGLLIMILEVYKS